MKRKRESYTHGPEAPWEEFQVVGKPHPKVDGLAKATGEAIYADDIQLPGMLHAKTLRSPHPHARIVSIDTSRAEALAGVHAVITGGLIVVLAPIVIGGWVLSEPLLLHVFGADYAGGVWVLRLLLVAADEACDEVFVRIQRLFCQGSSFLAVRPRLFFEIHTRYQDPTTLG